LSTIPGAEVTTVLGQALAGMDMLGKVRVLAALADRGDKGAIPVFLRAAKDPAQPVRVAALQGLGKIGDASVVLLLAERAAKEADTAEQTAAADLAAARTGGLPNERQIAPSPDVTEQAAAQESLYHMRGADVDKAILAGIATAEPKAKVELIKATSERGLSAATPTLLRTSADSNRDVRRAALRALRGTAGPADAPVLIDLLKKTPAAADRSEVVRALASALRRSDAASLNPVMSAYQSTSDAELRGSLLTVLAQVGKDESLPVLRGALKDGNADIRRGAILALSEWPNATPLPELLEIAKSEPNPALQVLSLRGYIRLVGLTEGRPPAETLRMLAQAMSLAKQADEKKAVLALLPGLNSPEALALAEASMNDPEVASEARMAAERIRQRRVPGRKQQ
jgi:HEAT repeat protein